jgi:hypothetical protein
MRIQSQSHTVESRPKCDIYTDIHRHIGSTAGHRAELKKFIHVYSGIQEALQQCVKALEKLIHSEDCGGTLQSNLCRYFVDIVSVLHGSLRSDVVSDLREMKTAAKDKLSRIEQETKQQAKEISGMIAELERFSSMFEKVQAESKSLHAKAVDPSLSPAPRSIWSPSSNDKDKIFSRLQKIDSERDKLTRESEDLYSTIVTRHTTSYSRVTHSLSELASMRRRLNRKLAAELKATTDRVNQGLLDVVPHKCGKYQSSVQECFPTEGDFGMILPSIDESLTKLVGFDRESRIKAMRVKVSDVSYIEYRAIQTYIAKEQGELSFTRNERIHVTRPDASGWWTGRNESGQIGIFPCVLVVERPAGAPLPNIRSSEPGTMRTELRHGSNLLSHRPHILRDRNSMGASPTVDSAWKSTGSIDERVAMIRSRPPGNFCAIAHFPFYSDSIYMEAGEWVKVESVCSDNKFVMARNSRGQCGRVPLNVLTVKEDRENNENSVINW